MLIPAHLDIIVKAVCMAIPFYFFNRYLVKKMRPRDNGKRLISYFTVVLITAVIYSIAAVFVMVRLGL